MWFCLMQADLTTNQTVKIGFPLTPNVTGPAGSGSFEGSRGTVGVTLLPEKTVPSANSKPAGLCTSVGGAASGYSNLPSQQYLVSMGKLQLLQASFERSCMP